MFFTRKKAALPGPGEALPGRQTPALTGGSHFVSGAPLHAPSNQGVWPGLSQIQLGLGCFWGAERLFWNLPGVAVTAVGYAGGQTPNPTYEEVCSGMTGHTEVVLVVYDPAQLPTRELLATFFENHDPTQGMRQGNDIGTQYRSAIYTSTPEQLADALAVRDQYQQALSGVGFGPITTEIRDAPPFYYAEDYHQQYLAKNPGGYCGIGGVGVACQVGVGAAAG